jgi:hypothetical protein
MLLPIPPNKPPHSELLKEPPKLMLALLLLQFVLAAIEPVADVLGLNNEEITPNVIIDYSLFKITLKAQRI